MFGRKRKHLPGWGTSFKNMSPRSGWEATQGQKRPKNSVTSNQRPFAVERPKKKRTVQKPGGVSPPVAEKKNKNENTMVSKRGLFLQRRGSHREVQTKGKKREATKVGKVIF